MYFSEIPELPEATGRTDAGTFFFPSVSFCKEADLCRIFFPETDMNTRGIDKTKAA